MNNEENMNTEEFVKEQEDIAEEERKIDKEVEKELKDTEIKLDKASFIALEKSYKGGYLDGMIAGLHSAGVKTEDIAKYLGAEVPYVEQEVYYFKRTCEESGKMNEFILAGLFNSTPVNEDNNGSENNAEGCKDGENNEEN